jgi:DNA integrity scanning protein DisA with diadenylate cyclase activity
MAQNESPVPDASELSNQIAALQRQLFSLLLVLIVVSGTVTVYLYREASLKRKDIEALRPTANQIIETFGKNREKMLTFLDQLNAYALNHPDIKQILARNGFNVSTPAAKK